MESNKPLLGSVTACDLPHNIFLCYQLHPPVGKDVDIATHHNRSGSELTEKMILQKLNASQVEIITQKNEKPRAYADTKEVSVSFSHTGTAVVSAISSSWTVGCDMESVSRKVHPNLVKRMKHPDESLTLYKQFEPVRIWTLKESALKMIGTGLRKPMRSVSVSHLNQNIFEVEIGNGNRAKICSFIYKEHWISVCYQ
ncbi:MAG: 4'-phosphopantetheinyl transferase superfamily protein [Bacteroidetes bacterium]|jgi:4'-phosphopantetheinyl transferase|nr:4'-phosphopantetheinyl transferase superfamily protein [Bacteroidota bacterium]